MGSSRIDMPASSARVIYAQIRTMGVVWLKSRHACVVVANTSLPVLLYHVRCVVEARICMYSMTNMTP